MRFPGGGLPGRSGRPLGPSGERYRSRSDEAVGARAGPRRLGYARQVSRAADERRQGQRGRQANRQRTGGVLVGARSDLPHLFARGYSRILRAAAHPGPCARLAGGVRGSREGNGETGDGGEKETGAKPQVKLEGQPQTGSRHRTTIKSEVRVADSGWKMCEKLML